MQLYTDTISNDKSNTYGIECLRGRKVLDTRPLWEEVFSEDSKAFTDYYFAIKAVGNTAFICRHLPTGEIVSMVHLTPCEMTIRGKSVQTYYIVGVATRESHRHKGLMSTLLNKSFDYAAGLHCPFVFLMPANPAIYEPFGFSYIYSRPQYVIPESLSQKEVYISNFPAGEICIQPLEKETSSQILNALADFASKTLSAQYDYYLTRTPSYYRTLLLELYAQNGCIYTFTLHGQLEGYFLYAKEEKSPFIQELLFSDKLYSFQSDIMSTLFPHALSETKPVIMAKNLIPASASLSNGSAVSKLHFDEASMQIPNYVNFLSTHKGFINEIV
ncbi:MAG: GNAT family N-acetyltransferase [Lachnospiraceae bacterium]|nr:GNAT family N-acetyltransferase [Lachnospiraceae bacterium]